MKGKRKRNGPNSNEDPPHPIDVLNLGGRLLRPGEVAQIFGVSKSTVWKWTQKGVLRAVRLPSSKVLYRYPSFEVLRLWKALLGEINGGKKS